MAFIKVIKNREGKEYVYLSESYRVKDKVKQRTLKNYGSLEDLERKEPGALERLRREAKEGIIGKEALKELVVSYNMSDPIISDDKKYGWMLFEELYNTLNISTVMQAAQKKSKVTFDVNQVLKLLTIQRILAPGSKRSTGCSQADLFGDWNISDNAIYRGLDIIAKEKSAIQLEVHKRITETIGRTASLVFYDITNYYFEIDLNDEDTVTEDGEIIEGLRKRGASKEKRPNPIVQLGLFMDTNGIPISYELFCGNKSDPITYLPAIEQVKKQFGLERIIVVADKAMNSKTNISATLTNGDGWLFSQKHRGKRGASQELQAFILDAKDWEYNESGTFGKKSMIRTRNLGKKQTVQEKVLVTWNEKYARREKARRDGALEYATHLTNAEVLRQTLKKGGKKYLELYTVDEKTKEKIPFAPHIGLDSETVDFDEQFDGINVLVTSELDMTDEEMIQQYKELSKIEDCFKITKSEFDARPVYVQTKAHIDAHFLTCFLALILMRMMQHITKWELSPSRLIEAVNSARANELTKGFYRVQANKDLIRLQELLDIQWTNRIVKLEDLKKYGTGWFTTQKK